MALGCFYFCVLNTGEERRTSLSQWAPVDGDLSVVFNSISRVLIVVLGIIGQ
jgi:hypothetical protein